jgi:hypothetical protein
MDNHIISILQKFKKPDAGFLQDKECLICLEPFDLESNKFVQLPCKCSNSAYHIDCIIKLLNSGVNKNFCPHCKSIYEIPPIPVAMNQVVPYNVINTQTIQDDRRILQIKKFTHILVCHIISNSIMNIINIVVSRDWVKVSSLPELQVLILFYFCKLFFNYVILMYSKNNIIKIEDCLIYSYVFQIILFCFFIYALTKIKNDINSTVLIVNNVLLNIGDLTFRIIIEYKIRNTVNVV